MYQPTLLSVFLTHKRRLHKCENLSGFFIRQKPAHQEINPFDYSILIFTAAAVATGAKVSAKIKIAPNA